MMRPRQNKTLVTGASGVLGREIITRLKPEDQIIAIHRTSIITKAQQLPLTINHPMLGLEPQEYDQLANSISDIIHCAAITDITQSRNDIFATNVDGTHHMIDLAKTSGATLHYVSTAFCATETINDNTHDMTKNICAYIESKAEAERLIRKSDISWTIIRPSIIVGHSQTGDIATFQGLHFFITSMLQGRLPFIPIDKNAHCDFVPVDYVANAISKIISMPEQNKTYWLTAGKNALTVADMIDCGQPFAQTHGCDLHALNIIDWAEAKQHYLPKLALRLPKGLRERLDRLMELAAIISTQDSFPSDFNSLTQDIFDDEPLNRTFLLSVLEANIQYWGSQNNHSYTDVKKPKSALAF